MRHTSSSVVVVIFPDTPEGGEGGAAVPEKLFVGGGGIGGGWCSVLVGVMACSDVSGLWSCFYRSHIDNTWTSELYEHAGRTLVKHCATFDCMHLYQSLFSYRRRAAAFPSTTSASTPPRVVSNPILATAYFTLNPSILLLYFLRCVLLFMSGLCQKLR